MKINLVITFLAFTTYCYSQTPPTKLEKEYVSKAYQIRYPKTWQPDTSKTMGADLFLFSPLENESDKFRENVNVLIQSLGGQNIDLEEYKQITEKQFESFVTEGKVFASEIITVNNKRFYEITYAMTQGKFRLKITSKCFIKNDKAYLVTFTSEIDKYDGYKEIAFEILNTFRLKE
jgi:hypothetical protein